MIRAIIAYFRIFSSKGLLNIIIRYIMSVHKRMYELNTGEKELKASIKASIIATSPDINLFW